MRQQIWFTCLSLVFLLEKTSPAPQRTTIHVDHDAVFTLGALAAVGGAAFLFGAHVANKNQDYDRPFRYQHNYNYDRYNRPSHYNRPYNHYSAEEYSEEYYRRYRSRRNRQYENDPYFFGKRRRRRSAEDALMKQETAMDTTSEEKIISSYVSQMFKKMAAKDRVEWCGPKLVCALSQVEDELLPDYASSLKVALRMDTPASMQSEGTRTALMRALYEEALIYGEEGGECSRYSGCRSSSKSLMKLFLSMKDVKQEYE